MFWVVGSDNIHIMLCVIVVYMSNKKENNDWISEINF